MFARRAVGKGIERVLWVLLVDRLEGEMEGGLTQRRGSLGRPLDRFVGFVPS